MTTNEGGKFLSTIQRLALILTIIAQLTGG